MSQQATPKSIVIVSALGLALWLSLFPLSGYSSNFSYSLAVVLVTLVGWSTGVLPPFMIALIFFALTTVFGLLDPQLLFSGFGSTAVWLIISGFVIGSAITTSGLGDKLATFIAPYVIGSYTRLITVLVMSSMLLGFIMPSSVGRAVVLVPIGMALAKHVGFTRGSNGSLGVATSLALACNMPSFAILPANIPNMILSGASETLFDVAFGYTEYLFLHFPVLGLVKSLAIIGLTLVVFPDRITLSHDEARSAPQTNNNDKQQSAMQQRVLIILGVTLLLWITDSIHGVNPAWVGLVASIVLLLPKWGVVETKSFSNSVDFGTLVFVASALGLGALVNESGIGHEMGIVFGHIVPGEGAGDFLNFVALTLISTVTGLVATTPGVPTVLTPMAAELANTTGFSVPAVLMTQVVGFSTVIFPYQVAPLIVAMQLSQEPLRKLLRLTIPLTVVTLLVLVPLDYWWWVWLGWLA